MARFTVRVPDIGEFEDVEVIEVLVSAGDRVEVEDSLITLESDKAAMEIPAPRAGVVEAVLVSVEDRVSEGTAIVELEVAEAAETEETEETEETAEATGKAETEETAPDDAEAEPTPPAPEPEPAPPRADAPERAPVTPRPVTSGPAPDADLRADVLVVGAGPGGYTAAFRAADLGKRVVLVERYPTLGGVCLNVGCIPSKALLHVAEVIAEAEVLERHGVRFGAPEIDFAALRAHKDAVVKRLVGGLAKLAEQRGVQVVTGTARLASPRHAEIETADGTTSVAFDACILAAGSRVAKLPHLPDDPRVLDSTSALEVDGEARRLLVIGGGIIGLEMAAVYDALGSEVTVVELLPQLMTGADPDVVRPLHRRIQRRYAGVHLETKVTAVRAEDDGLHVDFEGVKPPKQTLFDRVLVAVGRIPNGDLVGAEKAGVHVDERGFVPVDARQRTNVPHIYAIGDMAGAPLLAHKAMHEGKVAAEVIAGEPAAFDTKAIPAVAYTDPEVAWVGLTETQAAERGTEVRTASFSWVASGRALGIGRTDGLTKLVFDPGTRRLLGAGITGPNAGELVSELTLALESGADVEDVALTIHPHPTLSETVGLAAEVATGTVTDILNR